MLIGGRTETRHFLQLGARGERAVLLAVIHDVLCKGRAESADVCEEVDAGCVEVNAYGVHTTLHRTVKELMSSAEKRKAIDIKKYVTEEVGIPTLTDIMNELEKPGRDPRAEIETFEFDPNVHTPDDLIAGMVLPGIVTNLTKFGAFVDIGVHQDGLIHISQMADKYISDPSEVLHLHQHVKVRVVEVDRKRNRIGLSLRGV